MLCPPFNTSWGSSQLKRWLDLYVALVYKGALAKSTGIWLQRDL